jgi:hypothetical protein
MGRAGAEGRGQGAEGGASRERKAHMLRAVTCGQMPPPSEIAPPSPASSAAAAREERSAPPQKIFSNLVSMAIVSRVSVWP